MLRRSIYSSRRTLKKLPKHFIAQDRFFSASSKNGFTSPPSRNGLPKPNPAGKPTESKGNSSKILLGSAFVAGASLAAYQAGYVDKYLDKGQQKSVDSAKFDVDSQESNGASSLDEQTSFLTNEQPDGLSASVEQKVETQPEIPQASSNLQSEKEERDKFDTISKESTEEQDKFDMIPKESTVSSKPNETHQESTIDVDGKGLPQYPNMSVISDDQNKSSETSGVTSKVERLKTEAITEPTEDATINPQASSTHEEINSKSPSPEHPKVEVAPEDTIGQDTEKPASLLEEYHLKDTNGLDSIPLSNREDLPRETEALVNAIEGLNDGYVTKDGKLVLDFLTAIHAAEKRQAELDAMVFAKEKRAIKERYEDELRDLRARELMRMEEAAILEKELKRERAKAAAAVMAIQEKMEEKLLTELKQKETEAQMNLEKTEELAKAEMASAIAKEKAAQIEKMIEADLNIKALSMAFYARSEEARKSHSVHKLALGTVALEDALSKGLPIQKETDALQTYLEGIQEDSILHLVLSSLPEETLCHGTDSILQLNQKFNTLKGTLRHFSLIPPGGGGILAHSLAHVATWLKVKEADQSGEGIESVIKRVDNYLAEGNLAEAAAALEEGVKGSQAEKIVSDWVKQARNRAITEQALTLLQSYATCVSLT